MPLVDLSQAPSRSMQRWFGLSLAILLLVIAYSLHFWSPLVAWVVAAVAGGVGVIYYTVTASQLPIIRGWQYITFPIAWVVGHLLFGMIYYGIVVPIGMTMRWAGYDPLELRWRAELPQSSEVTEKPMQATSGWLVRTPPTDSGKYFKQF